VAMRRDKEVFDAVALVIEVFAKDVLDRTIGLREYDGAAAEFVHMSADSVADMVLVHDGKCVS